MAWILGGLATAGSIALGLVLHFCEIEVGPVLPAGPAAPAPAMNAGPPTKQWTSARPIVIDVDKDRVDDLISSATDSDRNIVTIEAVSGTDGRTLWQTELLDASATQAPKLWFDGEFGLVLVRGTRSLAAYRHADGIFVWRTPLTADVESIEFNGSRRLHVTTRDTRTTTLRLGDGLPADPEHHRPEMFLLPHDDAVRRDPATIAGLETASFAGLTVRLGYCPQAPLVAEQSPECGAHGLVWATSSGRPTRAYLLGYDPVSKVERWREDLLDPSSEPRAVLFGDSAIVSFVPERNGERRAVIQRISLIDGSVAWERSIVSDQPVRGLVVATGGVVIVHETTLCQLDLATGERRWKLEG